MKRGGVGNVGVIFVSLLPQSLRNKEPVFAVAVEYELQFSCAQEACDSAQMHDSPLPSF